MSQTWGYLFYNLPYFGRRDCTLVTGCSQPFKARESYMGGNFQADNKEMFRSENLNIFFLLYTWFFSSSFFQRLVWQNLTFAKKGEGACLSPILAEVICEQPLKEVTVVIICINHSTFINCSNHDNRSNLSHPGNL